MMKTCNKCDIPLELDLFSIGQSICKNCTREYGKIYRQNNQHKIRTSLLKRKENLRRAIYKFYKSQVCIDCGEDNILKLDCDHLNNKKFQISTAINKKVSEDTLKVELAKCVVRCANCHRHRTLKQFNSLKIRYFNGDFSIVDITDKMNWNQKRKILNRKIVYSKLETGFCVDCGDSDPLILEFDHLKNKIFQISEALYKPFSKFKLEAELAKCELRCANCHRLKTAIEQNHPLLSYIRLNIPRGAFTVLKTNG